MISYLITDPKYYGDNSKSISSKLKEISKTHRFNFACLRDKNTDIYESFIEEFMSTCKTLNAKAILHNYLDLALKYNVFGIHFSSENFGKIEQAKKNGLFVISSTHSFEEAQKAIKFGSDFVTLSPIFHSPNKANPIGLEKLKEITDKIPNQIIALGGILNDIDAMSCKKVGAVGFASIRYFI